MMLRQICFLFFLCSLQLLPSSVKAQEKSPWAEKFNTAWTSAQAADEAKDWPKATQLYREVLELIPGEPTTLYALARCYAWQGENDAALSRLEQAVESGWNVTDQLRTDAAFEKLRDTTRFQRAVKRIQEIERENILVYVPSGLDAAKPAPLIVAFHGRGENPRLFLPSWKAAADKLGVVVVAPRAPHKAGNGLLNLWEDTNAKRERRTTEIDLPACQKLAEESIALAKRKAKIDDQRIVLAGYSQGGMVALRLLQDDPNRYAGAFVQATIYKTMGGDAWRAAHAKRAGRVYFVIGELDSLHPRTIEAFDELKGAGWDARMITVPDCGHEPPEDNTQYQCRAIKHILAKSRAKSGE